MPYQSKELVRRWIEEMFNLRKLEALEEIFAPDYVSHDPSTPGG